MAPERRRWKPWAALAAMLALTIVLALVPPLFSSASPPLKTIDDLPALVPPEGNGAVLAQRFPMERTLWRALDHDPALTWQRARAESEPLRAWASAARAGLDAIDARPHYRDPCSPGVYDECDFLPIFSAHRSAGLEAIASLLPDHEEGDREGDPEENSENSENSDEDSEEDSDSAPSEAVWAHAEARVARAFARSREFGQSVRVGENARIYADLVSTTLDAAAAMASLAEAHGRELPALERALGAPFTEVSLHTYLVARYVHSRGLLEALSQPTTLFLDRARTFGALDAHFEALFALAADPSLSPPPPLEPQDGPLWWLTNAKGKQMLWVVMGDDPVYYASRWAEQHQELDAQRLSVLASLRRLARREE